MRWEDVLYGVRMLAKKPGFTAIAVLSLGLGIGANTAIFSLVNTILPGSLSFREPGRLVMIGTTPPGHPEQTNGAMLPELRPDRPGGPRLNLPFSSNPAA